MPLPPGRSALPVQGIAEDTDPALAQAAAELNAWIDYLLHPESHDGPRIYRERGTAGQPPIDSEMPRRMPNLDEQSGQYEVVPTLDGYQADPDQFFRPAQAVSGVNESLLGSAFTKLTTGCLTWTDPERHIDNDDNGRPTHPRVAEVHYPELHPARLNWMQMRKDFRGKLDNAAHEYENDFIAFQVRTENCVYLVAEHMARYRAIFKQASEDMTKLMQGLTNIFARHNWYGRAGFTVDFVSILITAIVAGATTVIGGGVTVARTIAMVATEAIGEAGKTAKADNTESKLLIEDHYHLRESAKQYMDAVTKIERDTAEAVKRLYESLGSAVQKLREQRRYRATPDSQGESTQVPHFRDYIQPT